MSQKCALVLDDHQLFGESFAVLLEKYTEIKTVHTFQEISELFRFLSQHSRQNFFIFLDYYLKDTNGLTVLTDIRRLNKRCKIIFLTSASSWPVIYNIENHNPDGIISKAGGLDILLECIQSVQKDQQYLCPSFQELKAINIKNQPVSFTARELEILNYFVEGYTIAETAEKTFLSRHTIVAHRRNMMSKANCTSISQLLTYSSNWKLI
ncbi:two component transcriptional regulator, LuxR family [Sphingobacterium nematocida]|uniref:Two component transcriptional regulator, LuxR family n=1 Tax=Sphingobacterium nematocida TaxID=1513896 RepID=A0A1T5FTL8_9SPHI|nr:response regulator transcription factor [Sphingobacterium nematocida]SKB99525.1 two component transcriptional regulator, LuxR family [Sphingobacterium nematocida]